MKLALKFVAVGFGLSIVAALALGSVSKAFPTDQTLRASLLTHRVDFERIVAMAKEDDRLSRIAYDFTWLNDDVAWPRTDVGISNERWNDYRQEFRKVDASVGIIKRDKPTRIIIPITSVGLVPSGFEKGLVYSQVPLTPVVNSLDKRPRHELWDGPDHSHVLAYKLLHDHWYIYYEEW